MTEIKPKKTRNPGITKKPKAIASSVSVDTVVKRTPGRPSAYTEELAQEILDAIVCSDDSLEKICNSKSKFPNPDTVYSWMNKYKDFNDAYITAKRKQVQVYIDKSFAEMGQTFTNPLDFQMFKLKIEHIRWYASKLVPRLYGSDPQELENKIKTEVQTMLHDAMAKACKAKERDY